MFSVVFSLRSLLLLFFFTTTATTEIYTLSLHDALPILSAVFGTCAGLHTEQRAELHLVVLVMRKVHCTRLIEEREQRLDRKSTRLNSSHRCISYAVFCLKKKIKKKQNDQRVPHETGYSA